MTSPLPEGIFCLCVLPQLEQVAFPIFENGRRLYRCGHCGLHQLAPYPVISNADNTIYSASDYLDEINDEEFYGYFRALYDTALKPLLRTDSTVLDFGAGSCQYHRFLRDMGHNVHSLEINPYLTQAAVERFGLNNVYSSFDEIGTVSFDLVYANQVMEHIYNPLTLLEGPIAQKLKPGGSVVLTVPNFASLNRMLLGRRWIGYSPMEHIWFFTAASIRVLFAHSEVYQVKSVLVRSAVNTKHDRFRPRSAIKRAYYQTFMRVFEWLGRGDQLIVVLQKHNNTQRI